MHENKADGIQRAFKHHKAFISFIMAGDPNLQVTENLLPAMEHAGVDLVEIGIPFSDPVAEGVVIERSSQRARQQGVHTDDIFDMIKRVRKQMSIPIVLMTYYNPIYRYGLELFIKRCVECGVEGLIIPDMPLEETAEIQSVIGNQPIELILLIAPTSQQRIDNIVQASQGFLYCVSSMGVTGMREHIQTDLNTMIQQVKKVKKIPCAVGFGIHTPEQAYDMAKIADGIIVGSALVQLLEQHGEQSLAPICQYIKTMKKAIDSAVSS